MYEIFSSNFYVLPMMYIKKMKGILIDREIYIYIRQIH